MRWLMSALFLVQMYLAMLVFGVVFLPWAAVSRDGAYACVRNYCRYVRWSVRVLCGLRSEVRGPVPQGEVLIASKHQSFFDIILLVSVLQRPKLIMKASLRYAPVLGWYAKRLGCVPVNRGRRTEAIRRMVEAVTAGDAPPGQLIIFPQGTRVAPGAQMPYKVGATIIYEKTGQVCVPAATNVGLFWPRTGILRKPGLAVVEFLDPLAPGMPRERFVLELESRIEGASNRLMLEAGYDALPQDRHDSGA